MCLSIRCRRCGYYMSIKGFLEFNDFQTPIHDAVCPDCMELPTEATSQINDNTKKEERYER